MAERVCRNSMHVCGARLQDLHGVGAGRGMARPRKRHAAHVGRSSRHDRVLVLLIFSNYNQKTLPSFCSNKPVSKCSCCVLDPNSWVLGSGRLGVPTGDRW